MEKRIFMGKKYGLTLTEKGFYIFGTDLGHYIFKLTLFNKAYNGSMFDTSTKTAIPYRKRASLISILVMINNKYHEISI